jgi:outer membrane receptor protein involved in Fe transport
MRKFLLPAGLGLAGLVIAFAPPARAALDPDTVAMSHDPLKYQIVVSATKTRKDALEVPNATAVVSGDELRRHGTPTLAAALQDVVGLDTGEGSDNGMLLPNIGLWGLKEFDALLVTVDGVPVGGPFNPSLAQIPVEDIDRIEIVKGPQGTLYGVAAFAGMVQVFTRRSESGIGRVAVGGGSFSDRHAAGSVQRTLADGTRLRLTGSLLRSDGWQDRTGAVVDRGRLSLERGLGSARVTLDLAASRHAERWGTPMPYDAGQPVPGFLTDRNYAVGGARADHHLWSAISSLAAPVNTALRVENTLGATLDQQLSVRSFPDPAAAVGDTVPSAGVLLRPREATFFDDLRLVSRFGLGGRHELVTGTALTWGRTTAAGNGFDFDQVLNAGAPDLGTIPAGDVRSFEDRRTFLGLYAHDEWTPVERLTISGGGRYDDSKEKLHAQALELSTQELGIADDSRDEHAWSGDLAVLARLVQNGPPALGTMNLYGSWRTSFKPAAPNLTEPEGAKILDPEYTHALEAGIKARGLDGQVGLDLGLFQMDFQNMVVSILGAGGLPEFTNAGRERFKGYEAALVLAPRFAPGSSLSLGYAWHDARFVQFTFVTPDGQLRDVSGRRLELVPQGLLNARFDWSGPAGIGLFGALRAQGQRPLTRRNTFFAAGYSEWDAGASYELKPVRISLVGRNLGDDRHVTGESDIGDSQFYLAPPRRVSVEASWEF